VRGRVCGTAGRKAHEPRERPLRREGERLHRVVLVAAEGEGVRRRQLRQVSAVVLNKGHGRLEGCKCEKVVGHMQGPW